ncbi:MAG: VOC family protein [Deltaproteobacteria bacterium]|nr:VOC family protein [Deltaproteobacteria bacterium]
MSPQVKPNLQLIYVSNIERSKDFYQSIFEAEPVFTSPRYIAFSAGGDALFAIWTGGQTPNKETQRFSEIGIMLPSNEEVDLLFEKWKTNQEIEVIQDPVDEIFGRTFLVKDPDGHIIRICPID